MNLYANLFQFNFLEQLTRRGRRKVQAPIKGGKFGAKLTHLCGFWLDVSFFSHVRRHRSRFLFGVSFFVFLFSFSPVKNIVRSWLATTHLCMKIYLIAFQQVSFSKKFLFWSRIRTKKRTLDLTNFIYLPIHCASLTVPFDRVVRFIPHNMQDIRPLSGW